MAGVVVLDVAEDILIRLGGPTVTALTRRFDPGGRCLTCEGQLGSAPLSVRAYCGLDDRVTLVAYHAACAASAWVDLKRNVQIQQETWTARTTSAIVNIASRRWLISSVRAKRLAVMLVHPSLEMIRVRQIGLGDAVNADLEAYAGLGFADASTLSRTRVLRAVGFARVKSGGGVLYATAADRTWFAPVSVPVASLAAANGGVLIGVTCDRDPARLAVNAGYLEYGMGNGDILFGWAPLPGCPSDYRASGSRS